jgi:hypothetical protein
MAAQVQNEAHSPTNAATETAASVSRGAPVVDAIRRFRC